MSLKGFLAPDPLLDGPDMQNMFHYVILRSYIFAAN